MKFIDALVKDFPISADGMNAGSMQFATTAHMYSNLDSPYSSKDMLARGAATQLGKMTNMDKAVEKALSVFEQAGRKDAADVLLVISDGLPTGGTHKGSPADKA